MTSLIPVLITPLNKDFSIDYDGLSNILEYYKSKNISRLWILGTGAEDMAIPCKDRLEKVIYISEHFSCDFELLVGCSFFSLKDSFSFIERLNDLKLDSLHYIPYHRLLSEDQIFSNYLGLSSKSRFPFYAYTSANWSQHFSLNFIEKLHSSCKFKGIKFSTSNIVHTVEALSKFNDKTFEVIPAVVKQLLPSLASGAKSFTSVEASIFLDEIVSVELNFLENKIKDAQQSQFILNKKIKLTSKAASKNNFLRNAEIKSILEHRGLCKRWVYPEFDQISEDDFDSLSEFA